MTYISSTITDSNSPSVMCTAVEAALTTEGYTLTDTVVISTRTHRVWKNPAANNISGQDWYIDIAYTTTGVGTFGIYLMEGYNATTDLATRMAYNTTYASAFTAGNLWSPYGATGYSLENSNWPIRAGATGSYTATREVTLPATSFGYWISVTPKRIAMMFSVAPTYIYYSGLYEPSPEHLATVTTSSFPLVSAAVSGSPTNYDAAFTRYPKITGGFGAASSTICEMKIGNLFSVFNSPSVPGGLTEASSRFALRIPLTSSTGTNVRWGWLYDLAAVQADVTVTRGDTLTDGSSNVWVLSTRVTSTSVMMRQM